jgi:hypothetical protein
VASRFEKIHYLVNQGVLNQQEFDKLIEKTHHQELK